MAVLITGATGYIGHHIAKRLLEDGETVHALVRPASHTERLRSLGGDLSIHAPAPDGLTGLLAETKPQTVFHLAADAGADAEGTGVRRSIETNVSLAAALVEAMAQAGEGVLINAGSYWQFDETGSYAPNSLYAASKQAFQDILEHYARNHPIQAITLILYDVYGPDDWRNKITALFRRAASGERVAMTAGEQKLDMVFIDDVVDAFLAVRSLSRDKSSSRHKSGKDGHRVFFAGSGRQMTLRDIAGHYEQIGKADMAIDWGAIPYPPSQLYRPCRPEPPPPGWRARISLEEGLKRVLGAEKPVPDSA